MQQPKVRMYAVSLMAVNKNDELPPDGTGEKFIYWAHRPAFCLAESLEKAGENGRPHVYKMFPESDGYSMHSVVVAPIEAEFFGTVQMAVDNGLFIAEPDPTEKVRTFNFDPSVTDIEFGRIRDDQ